jgi:hypothetical protein
LFNIISVLKESNLFSSVEVLDLIDEETVSLIKVKAQLKDGTLLYITELYRFDQHKYSYHWQTAEGELIVRWDNKPHWKDLKTFPHHKHIGGEVLSSHQIDILEVLDEIKKSLN